MIWDFRGEDGHQTAIHHEIHLKEFVIKENIPSTETGVEQISEFHSSAFLVLDEPFMKIVRDALLPHRGELA
ncbi:MAG: hypothetical protein ACPGVD_07330 [Flavobacteriales bacterium]